MAGTDGAGPRILVLEDDDDLRTLLELVLVSDGHDVRSAGEPLAALEAATHFGPDLAILDVRLPGGLDGFAVARRLRLDSDLPIIFLTAAESIEDRLAGFNVGADDYIVKPFAIPELLARVRSLLRRAGIAVAGATEIADLVIDVDRRFVSRAGHEVDLTRIELDLLAALVRQRGQVVSKSSLLAQVWGYDAYDVNLVEVHVGGLRRKLEAHGPRLIHTVRGAGYVLRSEG